MVGAVNRRSFALGSVLALTLAPLALAGCVTPDPPKITPKSVRIAGISATGIETEVTLAAENPNGIDLDARSVDATLLLDGSFQVGKTTIDKPPMTGEGIERIRAPNLGEKPSRMETMAATRNSSVE